MPEWADELSITVMSRGVSEQIMPLLSLELMLVTALIMHV